MSESRRGPTLVAAGIFLSRIAGFVRGAAMGHFFGVSAFADAFTAAFRIPNLMQNLLGEGVLSAAFIPTYTRLLEDGQEEQAGRVAGAIAGLLAVTAGALTVVAVAFAGPLTSVLAPGFTGDTRDLTVDLVRIITPGVGFLVLSAWCLGVLNSHRRFFLSYVAPVLWNVVQVALLVGGGLLLLDNPLQPGAADADTLAALARILGVGTLVGGLAQLVVQLPTVRKVEPRLQLSVRRDLPEVRTILRAVVPVVAGRGVVQLSAYLDLLLASLLATGAVAGLSYALLLYQLPIALFGMSVAAAELPELARVGMGGNDRIAGRLDVSLARMGFYTSASLLAFLVAGDLVVGALFARGQFGRDDTLLVWLIVLGLSVGLHATTSSRLLQNTLYAVDDHRTPARASALRVTVNAALGLLLMFPLDRIGIVGGTLHQVEPLGLGPLPTEVRASAEVLRLGALGLAGATSVGAWLEYRLLRRAVARRTGAVAHVAGRRRGRLIVPAAAGAAVALVVRQLVDAYPALLAAPLVVGALGVTYVLVAARTRVDEAAVLRTQVVRLLSRRMRR